MGPQIDVDLLDHILGIFLRAQHLAHDRPNQVAVAIDALGYSALVARSNALENSLAHVLLSVVGPQSMQI